MNKQNKRVSIRLVYLPSFYYLDSKYLYFPACWCLTIS
nr:MAG TPA: hypothetical protein [Caudoviricetes sp.]